MESEFYVPCQDCGHKNEMTFTLLKKEKSACSECGFLFINTKCSCRRKGCSVVWCNKCNTITFKHPECPRDYVCPCKGY